MDMITKLPEMSDDALVNLRTNAKRLQESGNPSQRSNAAALLPAVEAEIGARLPPRGRPSGQSAKLRARAFNGQQATLGGSLATGMFSGHSGG
jgi:hypothetical protein